MTNWRIIAALLLVVLSVAPLSADAGRRGVPLRRDPEPPRPTFRSEPETPDLSWVRGVSVAGGDFGEHTLPGIYGTHYTYPTSDDYIPLAQRGANVARVSFRWERVQPERMEALDSTDLDRLTVSVNAAGDAGLSVVLDMHNYGRYYGWPLESHNGEIRQGFADVWQRLALHFRDNPHVLAYGVMNEPHDMPSVNAWPDAAQAAADAIRSVDGDTIILVGGDHWGSAGGWPYQNGELDVDAPGVCYEAHQYFDDDRSGSYDKPFDQEYVDPDHAPGTVDLFADWLDATDNCGILGEFNTPGDRPWLEVLQRVTDRLLARDVGGIVWAAGPWWPDDYVLDMHPDAPQWTVIEAYFRE